MLFFSTKWEFASRWSDYSGSTGFSVWGIRIIFFQKLVPHEVPSCADIDHLTLESWCIVWSISNPILHHVISIVYTYPLVIKHGNGKSSIKGGSCWENQLYMVHFPASHVWLQEGKSSIYTTCLWEGNATFCQGGLIHKDWGAAKTQVCLGDLGGNFQDRLDITHPWKIL